MAVGVLQGASQLGVRIPDALSLIGFDDLFLCEAVQPALTSLHLSRQEIASRAFYALQAAREDMPQAHASVILPHLVVRASTGPVGANKAKAKR